MSDRIKHDYNLFLLKRQVIDRYVRDTGDFMLIDAYTNVKRKQLIHLITGISLATIGFVFVGFLVMWMVGLVWVALFHASEEKFLDIWKKSIHNTTRSEYLWEKTVISTNRSNLMITALMIVMCIPVIGLYGIIALLVVIGVLTLGIVPGAIVIYCLSAVMNLDNLLIEEIKLIDPENAGIKALSSMSSVKGLKTLEFVTGKIPLEDPAQLAALESLIKMSNKIRIDDLANLLQEPRADLLKKLIFWGETYPIKIDGDFLVIGKEFKESKELNVFSSSLIGKLPTCHSCGELLEKESQFCQSCGEEVKNCGICKRVINFGDSVAYCPHCGPQEPFHRGHLLETVKMTNKCPRCKHEIKEGEVVMLEMGQKKIA